MWELLWRCPGLPRLELFVPHSCAPPFPQVHHCARQAALLPLTLGISTLPSPPTNPVLSSGHTFLLVGPGDPSCTHSHQLCGCWVRQSRARGWVGSKGKPTATACSSPCWFRDPLRADSAWKVSDNLTYLCPHPQCCTQAVQGAPFWESAFRTEPSSPSLPPHTGRMVGSGHPGV